MAFALPPTMNDTTSITGQDITKSNEFTIILSEQIIKLFHNFYHDVSYAGELKIRLLDRVVLGGKHSILQLIMEKEPGAYGSVNNSFYKFYLEFSSKVPDSRHPITRTVEFKTFRESYEPALSEEALTDVISNYDQKMLNIHAQEYFNCDICIKVKSDEKIYELINDEKKNDLKVNDIDYTKALKFDVNNTFTLKGADEQIFTYKGNSDLTQNLNKFSDY